MKVKSFDKMSVPSFKIVVGRLLSLARPQRICCAQYHDKPRDKKKLAAMAAARKAEKIAAEIKYQPFTEPTPLEDIVEAIRKTETVDTKTTSKKYVITAPLSDGLDNPFKDKQRQCIICKHNIPLEYKNTRLLSQFISPFTGRIYGSNITGLCVPMQRRISQHIRRARRLGQYEPLGRKN